MALLLENYRERLLHCFVDEFKQVESVLDVGCGDGELWTKFFANKARLVIGIDIKTYSSWKKILRGNRNIIFILADGSFLPFRDEKSFILLSFSLTIIT